MSGDQVSPCCHKGDTSRGLDTSIWVQYGIILLMLSFLVFYEKSWFQTLGLTFVAIVLEAIPFMLIGSLVGGFIEVFVSKELMAKYLSSKKSWLGIFIAGGFGLVFPVCECAIVPVIRRLMQKGMPPSVAVAYLLGGPIVNPLVLASTATAYFFDWSVVGIRMGVGYLIAVSCGFLIHIIFSGSEGFFSRDKFLIDEVKSGHGSCHHHNHHHSHSAEKSIYKKSLMAINHGAIEFFDIARFLIIGAFCAGLLQTVIARDSFVAISETPVLSIIMMMVLAIVSNLCSESDAFIAASFRGSVISLPAQMAFMIIGPMLDIKLLIMYLKVFRKRGALVLACLTFTFTAYAMFIFEWIR